MGETPEADSAADLGPRVRPNPLRWLWYAVGGRLPQRHRAWVLHDLTCRTWLLRQAARTCVQISPGLLILAAPGPLWIRLLSFLAGFILALWYALSYVEHSSEYRLVRHGFAFGTGARTRARATQGLKDAEAARYAARYRNTQESQQVQQQEGK